MLHFKKGTRFGRALIFSALLLLVGIVFCTMNPFYNLSDFLGGSNAGVVTMIAQPQPGNVPDNVPLPACKVAGGPCMVAANGGAVVIGPGTIPAKVLYIRKVKPGPAGGTTWASIINT